jgi:hypothetical protein
VHKAIEVSEFKTPTNVSPAKADNEALAPENTQINA